MSPSAPGGPAAHRVAIISFPVTKEVQILWSPHRGREERGEGNQRQSHSRTPDATRPAPPPGEGGSAPSRSCHREERRDGPGFQRRSSASAFMAGGGEREQMCQSSARGRRRLLRHPSLVRLIAPARHLPLPPAPPIQSPSRGEERAGGEKREAPAPSYFATLRRSCRRRERGRGSAAPGRGGREGSPGWRGRQAGRSSAWPSRTLINWWRTGQAAGGPLVHRAGRKPPP